jgi:enoyl-CoA hydratase/carnithine racemase
MQTGDALQMLFKGEQIRPAMARGMGLLHEVAPRAEIVEQGQGLDQGRRRGVAPVGPENLQAALEQGAFAGRAADLAAGQRHLPPRDARQLPGRQGDPDLGL